MNLFNIDALTFFSFVLTFMRVSIMIYFLPFFGGDTIPTIVKTTLCLVLTLAIWPHLALSGSGLPTHPFGIALIMFHEALLGLVLGLSIHFVFAGLQTGGQYIGMQMGFSMISFADPLSGTQITVTTHLIYMTSLVLFLTLDGHLHLLRALTDSFAIIPAGAFIVTDRLAEGVIMLSAEMYVVAVRVAAPMFGALFLVELTLALMGRATPQMNLLTMGFPLKIAVGFFFMGLIFTLLGTFIEELVLDLEPLFKMLMRAGLPSSL